MTALWIVLGKVPRLVWEIVAGCLVLVAVMAHERSVGAQHEQALAMARKSRVDSIEVVKWDTVVTHDTVRLARTVAHYETLHDSVLTRLTDTLYVKAEIAAADTVIRVCRATVGDLLSSCARKDTLIADLRAQLALPTLHDGPSWKSRIGWAVVGAGAMFVVRH